jgi:hypothetical protein
MSCPKTNVLSYYTKVVVDPCGIALNLLCVLCFAQITWAKTDASSGTGNMFKYLLVKAVCDLVYFTDDIFYLFNYTTAQGTWSFNAWFIVMYNSVDQILLLLSSLMETIATLGKNVYLK